MDPVDIFNDWSYQNAELLKTDVRGTEYDRVDVETAASRARDFLSIQAKDKGSDTFAIPLFAKDGPKPTNEYVYYRPKRGQIGWFDSGFGLSGTERFTDCQKLETNEIGHRLRFWQPDQLAEPDLDINESSLPPDQISPKNQLRGEEQEAFFTEMKRFVLSERDAELEANWEQYTELGLEEAIRRNQVSGPFVHVSGYRINSNPAYTFQLVTEEDDDNQEVDLRDDEGLFNGNYCILDIKSGGDHFPVPVELLSVDDPTISFQPDWSKVNDREAVNKLIDNDGTEIWLHELLNPVPFERRITAIQQVEQTEQKRDLLTGQRPVEFSVNKYALPSGVIELNKYQRRALIWADATNDIVCIHGPPGTGKTRTLTAYVHEAASSGQSVLVTAHSNQAVDNLLVGDSTQDTPEEETLHALAQDPDHQLSIARVGNNSQNPVVVSNYANRSTSRADVVAATTSGAAQFAQDTFDVAVVDEATQASRPATAIVLNCAQKMVLAGDHKQLPPYCADETMQEEDLHISLFEYLLDRYADQIALLLKKQYRMNEEIAAFPNRSFYDGDLETAEQNRNWTVGDLKPLIGIDIDGTERRQTQGTSYYNEQEAEAVAKQVKLLIQSGVAPSDIGVITAYSGQIGRIRSRINQLDIKDSYRVTVDTVDSFQGGEREAIIVSFVRSNTDGVSGFLEFPDEGPRRLNVAVTRARKRLVLVGNWETLGSRSPHRSADESCAHLYAELEEHIRSRDRMLSQ